MKDTYLSLSLSLSPSLSLSRAIQSQQQFSGRIKQNLHSGLAVMRLWIIDHLTGRNHNIHICSWWKKSHPGIIYLPWVCGRRAPLCGNCLQSMLALIWSESGHWPCWLILKLTLLTPLGSHRVKSFPLVPPPVRVSTTEPSQPGLVGI